MASSIALLLLLAVSVYGQKDKICETSKVILVVDRSGSLNDAEFLAAKTYSKYLVDRTQISPGGSRAGVVFFAKDSNILAKCDDHDTVDSLNTAIDNFDRKAGGLKNGMTNINLGIKDASDILSECDTGDVNSPKVVVVITDGRDNVGDGPKSAADALRAAHPGVDVFAIGVGAAKDLSVTQLKNIANNEDNTLVVKNFAELQANKAFNDKLAAMLCPPEPKCNCSPKVDSSCLSWGKQDIFFFFKGLCYADKLKEAKKYLKKKINQIKKRNKKLEECIPSIKQSILQGTDLFKRYNKCYSTVYCVHAEHLRKLKLKLQQINRELQSEEDKDSLGFLGKFVRRFKGDGKSFIGVV